MIWVVFAAVCGNVLYRIICVFTHTQVDFAMMKILQLLYYLYTCMCTVLSFIQTNPYPCVTWDKSDDIISYRKNQKSVWSWKCYILHTYVQINTKKANLIIEFFDWLISHVFIFWFVTFRRSRNYFSVMDSISHVFIFWFVTFRRSRNYFSVMSCSRPIIFAFSFFCFVRLRFSPS